MSYYLMASPNELGSDIYLEDEKTYLESGAGVAVYAEIKKISGYLESFVGSRVAHKDLEGKTTFQDKAIEHELKGLLRPSPLSA